MKGLLNVLLVALLCVGVVSCGKKEGSAGGGKKLKIGILAPAVTHGWVAGVAFYAEQRCKELADTVEYKVCTSESAEQMTNQLDELQAWGAQSVVAFPQWEGMEAPIGRAIKAGVHVVNFDIAINVDGVYRVSGDNEGMGRASADYIVEKMGKEPVVVLLPVPTSGSVSSLRMKGFNERIREIAPNAKLIEQATKFTQEDGLKDFADVLTKHPRIDAVFSLDDETSMGVLQAIREANRKDIKVVTGGGGCQKYFKLMPDSQDIWIQSALYSPSMVIDAVDMACDLAAGKTVAEKVRIIPTKVVDRTNCADQLNANSPY